MTSWRAALILLLLTVMGLPLFAQGETLRYSETHGTKTSIREYHIQRTSGASEITATSAGATEMVRWQAEAGTVSWRQSKPPEGTDFSAERSGNSVRVTGTSKGRKVAKEIRLDAAPWYQIFGPLISELLPAGSNQREFWVVNPEDFSAHKMMARRTGQERIPINGVVTDALKVHFSPAGALAPFWGADFWYRPSDGTYLFSRLPENGGLTVATLGTAID